MSRRPSFPFFTGDFLTGTNLMSCAAVGAYVRMLCNAWETGPIPDSRPALWHAMHLGPEDPPFEQIWAEVRPKWQLDQGGWINLRLEATRIERDDFITRQRAKGRLGGQVSASRGSSRGLSHGLSQSGLSPRGLKLPTPTPTPIPDPSPQDQKQCADAHDAHKILTKLAHGVLDARDDGQIPNLDSELASELKTRAAQARIPYDGRAVAKALESAHVQRSRR